MYRLRILFIRITTVYTLIPIYRGEMGDPLIIGFTLSLEYDKIPLKALPMIITMLYLVMCISLQKAVNRHDCPRLKIAKRPMKISEMNAKHVQNFSDAFFIVQMNLKKRENIKSSANKKNRLNGRAYWDQSRRYHYSTTNI
jgi:hypothetical protein